MDEKRLWWLAAWQLIGPAAARQPDGNPFEFDLADARWHRVRPRRSAR